MVPKKSLLLVDSDARSMRVLEVSLRKAGFQVATAGSASQALELAQAAPPDLIVTESRLPDLDGFELSLRLKSDPRTQAAAIVFLSEAASPEIKIRAINAGADDFLPKPVLVKEIIARIKTILEKRQTESIARRERPGNLSGTLASMGVVDLLQVMETGKKSGIVHLSSDPVKSGGFVAEGQARATIFFRDGRVIDAKLGNLNGLEAVYRMLLWEDGVFEIEFKPVSREDSVRSTTQAVLLEGMRRVDEWSRYAEVLPPLSARLAIDFAGMSKGLVEVPASARPILHLFDGRRTLFEVVNDSQVEDVVALEIIAKLHQAGVLYLANRAASSAGDAAVEAWLTSPARPASTLVEAEVEAELPSALGRAVIPSPHSASEIYQGSDRGPVAPSTLAREPTALPEPIGEPSLILSRHTVPANRAVPLTQAPPAAPAHEPIPLSNTRTPRLAIQRASSVVATAPRPTLTVAPPPAPSPSPSDEDGWEEVKTSPGFPPPSRAPAPVFVDERPTVTDQEPISLRRPPVGRPVIQADAPGDVADTRPPAPASITPKSRGNSYVIAPAGPPAWPVSGPNPERVDEPSPSRTPAPSRSRPPEQYEGELSDFSRRFMEKEEDDEYAWDLEGSAWRRRLPGIALVASVLAVALVLGVFGKKQEPTVPPAVSRPQATKRPSAQWPESPESAVIIDDAHPTPPIVPAPAPIVPAPAPIVPAPPPPRPVEGVAAATGPSTPPPPAAVVTPPSPPKPVEEPPVASADPAQAKALVSAGDQALKAERFLEARKQYTEALKADAGSAAAHSGLAMAYVELQKDVAARTEAKAALKLDPGDARAHLALAIIAYNGGNTGAAKKSYNDFLKYEPSGKRADEVRQVLKSLP